MNLDFNIIEGVIMDLFKKTNNDKATAYDFYDTNIVQNRRERPKDKKILHRLSRARIKRMSKKEIDLMDV